MRLNTATVESWVLNGKDYTSSKKKFFKALCRTHNFKVKLVFGNKVLDRGSVTFMENSGWVIAHVDSRFMFDSDVTASGITVSISNKENEIVNSQTDVEYIFGKNKCIDADLYFAVGTIYPYNQLKQDVPESLFRVSEYDCSNKLNFDSLPDAADEDDTVILRSATFKASKDYSVSGGSIAFNNQVDAYTEVEINKSDWNNFISENPNVGPIGLYRINETISSGTPDPTAYMSQFMLGDFMSPVGVVYQANVQDTPSGDTPEVPFTLTTVNTYMFGVNPSEGSLTKLFPVTVKTYINNAENTDPAFVPVIEQAYPESGIEVTVIGGDIPEPSVIEWALRTSEFDVDDMGMYIEIGFSNIVPSESLSNLTSGITHLYGIASDVTNFTTMIFMGDQYSDYSSSTYKGIVQTDYDSASHGNGYILKDDTPVAEFHYRTFHANTIEDEEPEEYDGYLFSPLDVSVSSIE